MEIVERALLEEDRVRERTEPRHERDPVTLRIEHVHVDELGLDRVQLRMSLHIDVIAVDDLVGLEWRQRLAW